MRAEIAAAYCGVAVSTFYARVKAGLYPKAMRELDKRRIVVWDRHEIDRVLDMKAGGHGGFADPDEAAERAYEKRKARARRRNGQDLHLRAET
jgi:predicted DNA-binding transcriptional regulator AlpA